MQYVAGLVLNLSSKGTLVADVRVLKRLARHGRRNAVRAVKQSLPLINVNGQQYCRVLTIPAQHLHRSQRQASTVRVATVIIIYLSDTDTTQCNHSGVARCDFQIVPLDI